MNNNITYFRYPDIQGVEACDVLHSAHAFPKHFHEAVYAIGLMEEGGSYCRSPGDDATFVAPGQIALINPGQVHSGVPRSHVKVSYKMLYVSAQFMHAVAGDVSEKKGIYPEFRPMVVRDPNLFRSLRQLFDHLRKGPGRLERETALFETLARLVTAHARITARKHSTSPHDREIRMAKECLAADLDCKVSLTDIAASVNLSRYHLLRLFKHRTGVPPHAFRTQRRIEEAQQLLRQGMTIAQVAMETGFTDQSHFTHTFRKYIGATPRRYVQCPV